MDYVLPVVVSYSEAELIQALKAKNMRGLEQLYDTYGNLMYGLALRILKNPQEAEDLIQETVLGLWNNFTYNPQRGSLKTFLVLLVRSRAIDKLRSQQSKRQAVEKMEYAASTSSANDLPMTAAVSDEVAQRVQAALAELSPNQRQALELAYYDGLTQSEISQKLSVPVGTVKSWVRLSFVKLRQSLQDLVS